MDTAVWSNTAGAEASERLERRFAPRLEARRRAAFALGLVAAALLGAGVYGTFIAFGPVPGSGSALLGGVILAALAALWVAQSPPWVRVGDLGVALEGSDGVTRLAWHEIVAVRVVGNQLVLAGEATSLALPLGVHGQAARHVIAEAAQRIGSRVDISSNAHDRLPKADAAEAARVPVAGFQATGKRCRASGTPIAFEADARVCKNCGAIYHARTLPEACSACGAALRAPSALA